MPASSTGGPRATWKPGWRFLKRERAATGAGGPPGQTPQRQVAGDAGYERSEQRCPRWLKVDAAPRIRKDELDAAQPRYRVLLGEAWVSARRREDARTRSSEREARHRDPRVLPLLLQATAGLGESLETESGFVVARG